MRLRHTSSKYQYVYKKSTNHLNNKIMGFKPIVPFIPSQTNNANSKTNELSLAHFPFNRLRLMKIRTRKRKLQCSSTEQDSYSRKTLISHAISGKSAANCVNAEQLRSTRSLDEMMSWNSGHYLP